MDELSRNIRNEFHDADFSNVCFFPALAKRKEVLPHIWVNTPSSLSRLLLSTESKGDSLDRDTNNMISTEKNIWPGFFGDIPDDGPTFSGDDILPGVDNRSEIGEHINNILQEAIDECLPAEVHKDMEALLAENSEIFRIRLGADLPANLESMNIKLLPQAATARVRVRQYLVRQYSLAHSFLSWVSDQGSHFKNKLMTALNRAIHVHHHFTTGYCSQ